jgi:enoyl-CoA hydratase/carnithine racemase
LTILLSTLSTPRYSKASRICSLEWKPALRVVVFENANPEFYLAHFDLTGSTGNITTAVARSSLPILMDTFVRLTKSPSSRRSAAASFGLSSEFVLACDMRFASRENPRLGQPEVGVGVHPEGGGTERLPHLVGRGRALEIVLGGNDFDGDTAERYGYVITSAECQRSTCGVSGLFSVRINPGREEEMQQLGKLSMPY